MEDREQKISYCRLCEQSERWDDMMRVIAEVSKMPGGLSTEERNLLSVASKNAISVRRTSWRILTGHEQHDGENSETAKQAHKILLTSVENELSSICEQVLDILDKYLIQSASSAETKVFYYKMKADYYRYLAEFQKGAKRDASTEESLKAYKQATEDAATLAASNTVRLGLALNFSVFYYEIKEDRKTACAIAEEAYKSATEHVKSSGQAQSRDRMLILQLLEDNLNLWRSETKDEPSGGDS